MVSGVNGKFSGNVSSGGKNIGGTLMGSGSVGGNVTNPPVVSDYEKLKNLPQIEGNTLIGNKTFKQLGMDTLSVQEIEKILYLD